MDKIFLENIFNNRKVLISHYLIPKLKLVAYLLNNILSETIIFDENNYLIKTGIIDNISENIIVTSNKLTNPPVEYRLVYIEPSTFPYKARNRSILVTLTPGSYRFRIPRYYGRIYLVRASDNTYIIRVMETMEKYRFRIDNNDIVFINKPEGIYSTVYEIIRNAIIEYGELTTRDAVNLITKELSVSRENARKLIAKLVVDRYIRVEKGFINLY